MSEIETKAGGKLVINIAPWGDAKKLKAAMEKEAAKAGLKLDLASDASTLANALLLIDSSDDVDAALWPCLARCTRNGQKITPSTFDTSEGRADYYEIVKEVLVQNFRPLFESLCAALPAELVAMFRNPPQSPQPSL